MNKEDLSNSKRDFQEFVAEHDGQVIGVIRIESSNQDCLNISRLAVPRTGKVRAFAAP